MAAGAPPPGSVAIPNSRVTFRRADENSESVAQFDCGDTWWYEREVNNTVRESKWAGREGVDAYEFFVDGKTLGFAFLVMKKYPTPWHDSRKEAYVRFVYTLGINKEFRGKRDSRVVNGRTVKLKTTLAEAMMRGLEGLPREVLKKGKRMGEAVDMFLAVYVENVHARDFYAKLGFEQDFPWGDLPGGVRLTGPDKQPTIALRKPLPPK